MDFDRALDLDEPIRQTLAIMFSQFNGAKFDMQTMSFIEET